VKGANYRVVIDACVLSNHGVCDLFLRLAEHPRLYSPKWSARILDETHRTQVGKLGWPAELADHWRSEVGKHFPEAMVEDADCLEPVLANDLKDRHVLAAAIRSGASTIVTFNLRHFQPEALSPWCIQPVHPADYLLTLYEISPAIVVAKVGEMATDRGVKPEEVLRKLKRSVAGFASYVAEAVGWEIDDGPAGP
jgi:predicted nucleic acid-binding protein